MNENEMLLLNYDNVFINVCLLYILEIDVVVVMATKTFGFKQLVS